MLRSDKGIFIEGDIKPSYDNTNELGGEDNRWSAVWANEVNCDGGFITADAIEAGNRDEFTYNGFVDTLKKAKVETTSQIPGPGTFDLLCVYAVQISTGTEITGGERVFRLNLSTGKGAAPGISLSVLNVSTNNTEKWVAVTGAQGGAASEWLVVLAVRVP